MFAHALTVFCGIAGALGVAAGAGLLIVSGRMLRERTWRWRWLFEIDLIAVLDRRRAIERPIYRHHRAFGAAVIAGAVVLLVILWGLRDHPLVTDVLPGILGNWGAGAVILTSWALAVFALGIGMFLLIRPSALKGFETAANRWIESFPSAGKPGGARFITRCVLRAPRLTALLLLA
ncbi:MAG TPA: hypothetical protein VGQ27_10520, partial [Steroidobacteraceae bacterium]|nr:hypothetical protein [Steroidobacteraceae bacterium]